MDIRKIWANPTARRKWVTVVSGVLIALAIVAGRGFGLAEVRTGLMVVAAVLAGSDIALRAWSALRVRHIGIEALVTAAAAGALVLGEVWESAAVTFLFSLGAYLEARTMSGTRRAIEALVESAPATAVVLRGDVESPVPVGEVAIGETVLVRPGSRVPVDGEVIGGHGAVDESTITGEPIAAEKGPGSAVYAGTLSQGGFLRVRATGVGADTTLARIVRRVEEAQEARAPAQRFIERFARWYTPAIMGLSVVAYLVTSDPRLALTLLVIGCPGALVISIPVSVVAGIGRAARDGILIKGGEHLERAAAVTAVALDKTGTLTEGRPRLTRVVARAGVASPFSTASPNGAVDVDNLADVGGIKGVVNARRTTCIVTESGRAASCDPASRDALWMAAIAESGSEHPLARPILAEAAVLGEIPRPDRLTAVPGRGIRAIHLDARIDVGSITAFREWEIEVPPDLRIISDEIANTGGTPLLIAVDGVLTGVIGVADSPRVEAASAVQQLKGIGIERVLILTGDGLGAAHAVARAVDIEEVHAALLPDEKLDRVRHLQAEGEVVAMVGDGVNDAPALAQADVGVAMGAAGTDIAVETADIALMADDVEKLPRALEIARKTIANMRQNVALAVLTVAGLLVGVLLGNVHMAGGMLIHELSVLAVIANGMRLLRA